MWLPSSNVSDSRCTISSVRIICTPISPATIPHSILPESFGTFFLSPKIHADILRRITRRESPVECSVACRIPHAPGFYRPTVHVREFFPQANFLSLTWMRKRSTRSRPQVSITQPEWSKAARQTRSAADRQGSQRNQPSSLRRGWAPVHCLQCSLQRQTYWE